VEPFWISAFLDFAPQDYAAGARFWSAVTGYPIAHTRGRDDEFASLVPPSGGAYLKLQRLADGPSRIHLDLHVEDARAGADHALILGCTEIADFGEWIVMQSPAGILFCYDDEFRGGEVPPPAEWPDGHRSRVDQICLDIPPEIFDEECHLWAQLTGRELGQSRWFPEFRNLERPKTQALRFLLQRLESGPSGVHFDVATTDRNAETERHLALGARVVKVNDRWTVLNDPIRRPYCIIDRPPT
jgi:hypothetical protein